MNKSKLYKKLEHGMESRLEDIALKLEFPFPKVYRDYTCRVDRLSQAYAYELHGRESHIIAKAFRGTEDHFKKQYTIREYIKED